MNFSQPPKVVQHDTKTLSKAATTISTQYKGHACSSLVFYIKLMLVQYEQYVIMIDKEQQAIRHVHDKIIRCDETGTM